jgi:hypothetical protein
MRGAPLRPAERDTQVKTYAWKAVLGGAVVLAASPLHPSYAADHRDGPATKADPAADINDVFAFPRVAEDGATRLVLAMTVHPYAGDEASFSDRVEHVLRVRRASVTGTGAETGIETGEETRIVCRLESAADDARMSCRVSGACGDDCPRTAVAIGDEGGGDDADLQVFAGLRADPFFSDVARVRLARARGIDLDVPGVNTFGTANVLVLVADIDVERVLGGVEPGSTFAVAAETRVTKGAP